MSTSESTVASAARAREILGQADSLRRQADHAREVFRLSAPATGLGLQVGNLPLHPQEAAEARNAIAELAERLDAEAAAVESVVTVAEAAR